MNLWDKFYYLGEHKRLRGKIWTLIEDDYFCVITESEHKEYIKLTDQSLLQFLYNDTPKYVFNDAVVFFYDGAYVDGLVSELIPSYTNKPHSYNVLLNTGKSYTISQDLLVKIDRTRLLDSTTTTRVHVQQVASGLNAMATLIIQRGLVHDESKYSDPEKTLLDAMEYVNTHEGNAPYGTPEYKRRTAILKPMLKHHYANNSHHPEHYSNGVHGMNLIDVVEMLCDWRAASMRNKEAEMNITAACERYNVSDQLKRIFINTAEMMGWAYK